MNNLSKKIDEIKNTLTRGSKESIDKLLSKAHPTEIAHLIERVDKYLRRKVFSALTVEKRAEVIPELSESARGELLAGIGKKKIVKLIEKMESDEAADLLQELPVDERKAVIELLGSEKAGRINELLSYKHNTAGALMQKELLSIKSNMKAKSAIRAVRSVGSKVKNLYYAFVVDEKNKLVGLLSLRKLIIANPNTCVSELTNPHVISVTTNTDQEIVAKKFRDYNIYAMPVVNHAGQLIGRITVDDVMDVMDKESAEDMFRLAGLGEDESVFDSPMKSIKKRAPWLLFNLLTAILAAGVVALFQGTIQACVMLAVFLPIIAGMGGNAGTQTLTVVTRGIALGEADLRNAKKIIFKEMFVGLVNGAINGVVMALVGVLILNNAMLGIIVFVAMTFNLLIAGLAGTIVPLGLKMFKQDPALASSVFVTTFTDICGFFALLGLSALLIHYLV